MKKEPPARKMTAALLVALLLFFVYHVSFSQPAASQENASRQHRQLAFDPATILFKDQVTSMKNRATQQNTHLTSQTWKSQMSKVLAKKNGDSLNTGKKETPIWVKTPLRMQQENDQACNSPFKHCCLGQCRRSAKLPRHKSSWKLKGRNLDTITDVLDYFPNNISQPSQDPSDTTPCSILFMGASMSADQAIGANCQLINAGYKLTSCNAEMVFFAKGERDEEVQCEANLYPDIGHFLLENENAKACPKVLITFINWWEHIEKRGHPMDILSLPSNKVINDNGGLLVFNWGNHCNGPRAKCVEKRLTDMILPMVAGERAAQFQRWRFLYKETEPQHWPTIDGQYISGAHQSLQKCAPTKSPDDWRNKEAQSFLKKNNLTERIPTIKVHDTLLPLWQLHAKGDCTHYCYSPSRLDVTWDAMLKTLKAHDSVESNSII